MPEHRRKFSPQFKAEAVQMVIETGKPIAEFAGDRSPLGMQLLPNQAVWDANRVRDGLVRYVAAELGGPSGVLIADETGFCKSGRRSAGVQRQHAGTAGKITNCQVGVFLAYAVPAAGPRVLVDRGLYVPQSWTGDRDRCGEAGIPEDTEFATKPRLARTMIERVRELGLPFAWVTADEAHGGNGELREWLEQNKVGYVVAVPATRRSRPGPGRRSARTGSPRGCRPGAGSGARAARGPRASGCMTGRCPRPARAGTC